MGRVRLLPNAMPRKKIVSPTEITPTPSPSITEAPVKQTKKKAKAEPKVEIVVAPTPEVKAKKPARTKVAAPKAAKVVVVAPPVEVESVVETVVVEAKAPQKAAPKAKKTVSRPTKAAKVATPAKEAAPEVSENHEEDLIVTFRPAPVKSAKGGRNRQNQKNAPKVEIPVVAVEEAPVDVPAVQVAKPNQRSKQKPGRNDKKTPVESPAVVVSDVPVPVFSVEDHLLVGGEELPLPTWRVKQKPAPRNNAPQATTTSESEAPEAAGTVIKQNSERRNQRNRRQRRPGVDEPTTATEPVAEVEVEVEVEAVVPVSAEELPKASFRRDRAVPQPPVKLAIPIPENGPQIVMRDGIPTLVRNHRVYPPLMFFGSPSDEKRATTVLDELRMASEAGIHLHSFLIDFEVELDQVDATAAFAAYMLAKAVEIDPESQVVFRLVFQAARGWQDKYPNGKYKHEDGSLAEPSVCDDEFWNVAKACLGRFSRQMRLLPLNEHILGLHLERGEWFFSEGLGYDNSKAAQNQFREWAKTRYNNDEVTLRASWFDGTARFDNITIPEYRHSGSEEEKFIRSSRKLRRYVDYHLFLSDATVQRIGDLAYTAKEASEGYFLVGASYGYTFEWSHPSSGHLSLGKLLRTPDIDFIAGPPSYRQRDPGGSAAFPCPIDSFALNGKLYISEEDFKTSLSTGHEPDDFNPTLKTPQALESAHWRGAGVALAHASGMAWMDLWGNGWLKTNSVWARASRVQNALIDRMQMPLSDPEVAIFIDERALAYLVDSHAFELLVQNVRESVLRAGVSAAFYLLSDLAHREKFPDSKLYLFLNAWDIRPELRAAIKSRLQCDGKVLFWLYSSGLFDAGRESLERAREVTGIALKPQPFYSKSGTTILNRRHTLSEAFPDKSLIGSSKLEPTYFAIPEGATVLGEYSQTGLPSFVVKEFTEGPAETHWTSVFLGEPVVNAALIRGLAQMAGAHVWNFHEDVVHVRAPFCTIHCSGAGPRAITLPNKFSAYNLLTDEWAAVDSTNLRFTATDGSTHVFLVGPKEELMQMLERDPSSVLRMEELPVRDSNVLGDISNFDVPIMKLDEWMEGSDGDEVAEDWFLRPQQIIEEPETEEDSADKIGRRRRRRGRPNRGGSEETAHARREHSGQPVAPEFGDLGMNVMFRKRE